jgi:hypothetical protein
MLNNLMIDILNKEKDTGKVPRHVTLGGLEK